MLLFTISLYNQIYYHLHVTSYYREMPQKAQMFWWGEEGGLNYLLVRLISFVLKIYLRDRERKQTPH